MQDTPFDRALRRLRRDRAAASAEAAWLHRRAADELLGRLELVRRGFGAALDLGCGDGYLAARLRERGIEVTPADAGARFAAAAGGVQCDEDRLPFADGAFDLVVSAGALDTVNDLPGALGLIRRALRPEGLCLAAFAGAGSLPRLRRAMRAADEADGKGAAARVHPQIDIRAAGDLLVRAGFAAPVVDLDEVDVRYARLEDLVADLRAMGATNQLAGPRAPIGRAGFAAAAASFAGQADRDGRTTERFSILHVSGWAPAPGPSRLTPARGEPGA